MVTKGIIVSIPIQPDDNKYRVRLPFFEDATEDAAEIVYDATLMEVPGIQQGYAVDDVVYCTFEDNDMGRPIIIGKLFVRDKENIGAEIETNNLIVNDRTKLSKRTSIGDATESDVANIKNIKNKVDKMGDTIFGALTLDNTINFTSGKDVNLLNAAGEVTQTITTNDLLAGGGGGSTKFIKGTPITLYDTDGTTPLHNLLPENILFYDGEQGSSDLFNYNSLNNKPSINGVTLVGNKTTDDLGIVSKFVKGTPINLYDTDGTTVLYSRNPENLVFYDGQEGSQVASNYMWAKPSGSVSLSAVGTIYQPTLIANSSRGTGFEIDSNGNIKCNLNGTIKVHITAFVSATNTTLNQVRIRVMKNGTEANDWVGANYGTSNEISTQAVLNVVSGDLINIGASSTNAANWGSLSNNSTILCEYIQDYYITQSISESNTYSTSEIEIGRWIDGKPIYRKVVSLGALPNATTKNVAHGISNIDLVISLRGLTTNGTYYTAIPAIGISSLNYAINIQMTSTDVSVSTGNDRSDYTGYAIIEYTKTTD